MSEFIDGLGRDATVDDVFHGVYGKVDDLVETLDALRVEAHGEKTSNKTIPGLPIRFNWSWSRHGAFGETLTNDSTFTTRLELSRGWGDLVCLLRRSVDEIDGVEHPSEVAAPRGSELSPDYQLERSPETGFVNATIKTKGFRRAVGRPDGSEPIGETMLYGEMRLGLLDGGDMQRLDRVSQRVLDAVTAVEMLVDGVALDQVLGAYGLLGVEQLGAQRH